MKQDIFRIFQYRNGKCVEIAFVASKKSAIDYLESSYKYNKHKSTFYFAQKIKVQE